jgi:hypothetical protein
VNLTEKCVQKKRDEWASVSSFLEGLVQVEVVRRMYSNKILYRSEINVVVLAVCG